MLSALIVSNFLETMNVRSYLHHMPDQLRRRENGFPGPARQPDFRFKTRHPAELPGLWTRPCLDERYGVLGRRTSGYVAVGGSTPDLAHAETKLTYYSPGLTGQVSSRFLKKSGAKGFASGEPGFTGADGPGEQK